MCPSYVVCSRVRTHGDRCENRGSKNKRRYVDTTLLAEGEEIIIELIKGVKEGSEKAGLRLNLKKIIHEPGGTSTVTSYRFLITSGSYNREEIKRRISLGKAAMSEFKKKIMRTWGCQLAQKLSLYRQ
jgi:hypothetical protein